MGHVTGNRPIRDPYFLIRSVHAPWHSVLSHSSTYPGTHTKFSPESESNWWHVTQAGRETLNPPPSGCPREAILLNPPPSSGCPREAILLSDAWCRPQLSSHKGQCYWCDSHPYRPTIPYQPASSQIGRRAGQEVPLRDSTGET